MKYIPFVVCLLVASAAFGQKTKKVVVENDIPEYKEVFYILVDSPDVKHGEYTRTFKSRYETREKGQYRHGRKAGLWTFTDFNGGVEQEIDFSNRKIISAKPFKSLVSSSVIKDGSLIENKAENLPLLLGGQSRMSHILVKYMRYPADARRSGIDGTVYISATVTKDGRLEDEQIEKGIGYGLDEEALRVIKMLPDEWLPVGWGNEPQECKIVLQVKYKLN
jgi:periplasmic protein TonB